MAVFFNKVIDGFDFVYLATEYDEPTDRYIAGVVLQNTDQVDLPGFHDALNKAIAFVPLVEMLAHYIMLANSPSLTGDRPFAAWSSNHIDLTINDIEELLNQMEFFIEHENRSALAALQRLLREEEVRRATPINVRSTTEGYVYLLQSPSKAYKIGRTRTPENRLKTFGVQLPFEVEYICLIATSDMYRLERQLHQRFATKRINGEWFALTPEDIEFIKGLAT